MLYLDSSALIKLIVPEPESSALVERIELQALASSDLALVEVPRAIGRIGDDRSRDTAYVLGQLALVPIDHELLAWASVLSPLSMRTLDAIHVAAALTFADGLDGFLTYDHRQREGAEAAGLSVESPS